MKKLALYSLLLSFLFVMPAHANGLQQADINQLVNNTPAILDTVAKIGGKLSKDEKKKMQMGAFEGKPYTTMANLLAGTPSKSTLDTTSQKAGYKNFDAYARMADRVVSVIMSAQWVAKTSRELKSNPEKMTNLFEYMKGESTPVNKRQKLEQQLASMRSRMGVKVEDQNIVAQHYDELASVFKLSKKKKYAR
jgi:hypothetical protein